MRQNKALRTALGAKSGLMIGLIMGGASDFTGVDEDTEGVDSSCLDLGWRHCGTAVAEDEAPTPVAASPTFISSLYNS